MNEPSTLDVRRIYATILLAATVAMNANNSNSFAAEPMNVSPPRPIGQIERLDPQLDDLIAPDAKIEVLAENFEWSEGPVWHREGHGLLFCDIPRNSVYKWSDGAGLELFLRPSGYTGADPRGGELGSNGLIIDDKGYLVLCQHGDRRVARLATPLDAKKSGAIYFTDPPYGLLKGGDPKSAEVDFNGVYRVTPDGNVTLVTRVMTKPNGLAFTPDQKTLYIGQSDGEAPLWRAFPVNDDGSLGEPKVFFDSMALAKAGAKGAPDGMKVDRHGNVFATGPGGVLVISPQGKHLGTIGTGQSIANCAFGGDDGGTLYMTSHMFLCRVKLKTQGVGF
jgi:gluconolactonase